ncbi:MAG: hypothetical protein A3C02_03730, partial [Candidatus Andersenbacteria bacterium RIFCSPHIGHO2_02_FULL_45_11]
MNPLWVAMEALVVASIVIVAGFFGISRQFADRVPSRVQIGTFAVGGIRMSDIPGAVAAYEQEFLANRLTVRLRDYDSTHTLSELGIQLNTERAVKDLVGVRGNVLPLRSVRVLPVLIIADAKVQALLENDFASVMSLPQNPTLKILPGNIVTVIAGAAGERIDALSLNRDISHAVAAHASTGKPDRVLATTIRAVPNEDPARLEGMRAYVQGLLSSGFAVRHGEKQFQLTAQDIASMLRFGEGVGVDIAFDEELLRAYLAREVAPKVHTDAMNARFEVSDGRVSQFALPQDGEDVDVEQSVTIIQQSLITRTMSAEIAIIRKPPAITDVQSTTALDITSMLARGETDYKGSPKNRVHNIATGTAKYHGLLIPPGKEFSFNEFLGPVTEDAGFKPELVIKNNVTTAEFGGGLCQVSTTLFRAAVLSGMEITSRRNHSYAVRYYGTPGFDATIYPPYTDFRFLNNTPGYILIQAKIAGTRLSFELWGTDDGREV